MTPADLVTGFGQPGRRHAVARCRSPTFRTAPRSAMRFIVAPTWCAMARRRRIIVHVPALGRDDVPGELAGAQGLGSGLQSRLAQREQVGPSLAEAVLKALDLSFDLGALEQELDDGEGLCHPS